MTEREAIRTLTNYLRSHLLAAHNVMSSELRVLTLSQWVERHFREHDHV